MNDLTTTATIDCNYAELIPSFEGLSSTSAQRVGAFVGLPRLKRAAPVRRQLRSTATLLKAFVGYTIQASLGTVERDKYCLLWLDEIGLLEEGGIDFPKVPRSLAALRKRNAAAIALLDEWLSDDSGYDEATWPALKDAIECSRTSSRRRFSD